MADEHDVLALLRQIHVSVLPLEIKNYLRDLVFSTRFGTPAPIDTAMIATFKTHGFAITTSAAAKAELMSSVAPQATVTEPRKPVALVIGFSRHAPQFAKAVSNGSFTPVSAANTVPDSAPSAAPVAPLREHDAIPEVLLETPPVPEVVPPVPEAPLSEAVAVPIRITPDEPTKAPVVTLEEPITLEPVSPSTVPPEVTPAPVTAAVTPAPVSVIDTPLPSSFTVPSERIAAIKREVNAMVGNPVNLIDVNNEVGREYMNALLDAMKKTIGATSAEETERAMARLERAFVAVKETLGHGEVAPAPVAEQISPATETPIVKAEVSLPTAEPLTEPVAVPTSVSDAPQGTESVAAPAPGIDATPVAEPMQRRTLSVASLDEADAPQVTPFKSAMPVSEVAASPVPEPEEPKSEPVASGLQSVAAVMSETIHAPSTDVSVPEVSPVAPIESVVVHEPSMDVADTQPKHEVITSVAKEKQLKELMEARQAAEAASEEARAAKVANNPLMADDVNSGLGQLLAEWKLFKSSGIFGTGPSGVDHPLYKKISQLTMAALLAGRFEGSTPEIKRSIADYMNGWRYEEGIVHEQGETFETYLRRVIRHILDNQTKQ